jgi:chloramphenicol-sensitive protein RarD
MDAMNQNKEKISPAVGGTIAAFAAYIMWGLFPLYWHQLASVPPLQILAHRIVWAAVFCIILMAARKRLGEIVRLASDLKTFLVVLAASCVVTANWGLYIWAINSGHVLESSLGYYINPLFSVLLGALFFSEKVDRWTRGAVAIAALGIIGAAIAYGSVPWVSLALGITFAVYGALKKRLHLDPLLGLTVETLAAAPFALAYLIARQAAGAGSFWNGGAAITLLLALAGVVTALPLFCFAAAANSISLQKMGFIQYVSPTSQLLLGLFAFNETPSPALFVAFGGVIIAVLMYVFSRKKAG